MSLSGSSKFIWGDPGTLAAGTRYMRFGTGTSSTSEGKVRLDRGILFKNLSIRAQAGPGAARVDTFTIRKNGVDTVLTASLTAAATSVSETASSVTFAAGDDISLKSVGAAGTGTSDVYVSLEAY
jgi:hypothetical protein